METRSGCHLGLFRALLLCTRVCSVQKVRARIDTFILKARRAKVDHLQVCLSRLSVDAISQEESPQAWP